MERGCICGGLPRARGESRRDDDAHRLRECYPSPLARATPKSQNLMETTLTVALTCGGYLSGVGVEGGSKLVNTCGVRQNALHKGKCPRMYSMMNWWLWGWGGLP